MDTVKKKQKWIIVSRIIYVCFLLFSIYNDLSFFDFSSEERVHFYVACGNPNAIIFYITVKIAFALLCYWVRGKIVNIIYSVLIEKNERVRRLCLYSIVIFAIYFLLIMVVYPGIWWANDADEFTLFSFTRRLQVQYHQGFMSSLMFLFGLMIYPRPVFVVLLQAVIGAAVLGHVVGRECERVQNRKSVWLLFAITVSPACLYFVAYPLRAWLFSIFFLAFMYKLYQISINKLVEKRDLIELTIWLILVVNYRTEIKFMILLYPIVLSIILNKSYKKYIVKAECILIISVLVISAWNQLGYQATKKTHSSLFMVGALGVTMNDKAFNPDEYKSELDAISKVLDLDRVIASNGRDTQGEKDESEYSDEEFRAYTRSIVKVLARNPQSYLKQKWDHMLDSIGLTDYTKMGYAFPEQIEPTEIQPYFYRWNPKLQENIAALLAGQVEILGIKLYHLFYAFWLPILGMIILLLYNLKKRMPGFNIVFFLNLCQFTVCMLFSPVHYQMYYFPLYLTGWFFIVIYMQERIRTCYKENIK